MRVSGKQAAEVHFGGQESTIEPDAQVAPDVMSGEPPAAAGSARRRGPGTAEPAMQQAVQSPETRCRTRS